MAVRMNGPVHYNMSGSPPPGYDGSPRGKGKPTHMAHKRGGYHYYGKSSGGKGAFIANGISNGSSSHTASSHHGFPHHRSHNHHHQQHHHLQHGSGGHHSQNLAVAYNNGYLNGYSEENGYGFEHRSVSPTKINGMSVLPPLTISGGPVQMSQSPPTPEQIQQQMQHPPPMPVPPHLSQTFSHPPTDISTLPPPLPSLPPPPPGTSTTISTTSTSSSINNNSNGVGSGKATGNGSSLKFQGIRGHTGTRSKQGSAVKEVK